MVPGPSRSSLRSVRSVSLQPRTPQRVGLAFSDLSSLHRLPGLSGVHLLPQGPQVTSVRASGGLTQVSRREELGALMATE